MAPLVFLLFSSFTSTQTTILGTWQAPDLENSTIEVYKGKDGLIYGKIVDSDIEEWIGEVILQKVKYNASEKAWVGEVYSLRMYFTVDVVITLENARKMKIVGSRFWMTKTFYWNK